MSLIKCSECGNEISDKAAQCPKCGNPDVPDSSLPIIELFSKTLLKIIAIFGILVFVVGGGLMILRLLLR